MVSPLAAILVWLGLFRHVIVNRVSCVVFSVSGASPLAFEGVQITVSSRFEKLRTLQIKNHSYEEA